MTITEDIFRFAGNKIFANKYNLKYNPNDDFAFKLQYLTEKNPKQLTFEVRTSNSPRKLSIDQNQIKTAPDILILADYQSEENIIMLGWEYSKAIAKTKDFYTPRASLRPIEHLDIIMKHVVQVDFDIP